MMRLRRFLSGIGRSVPEDMDEQALRELAGDELQKIEQFGTLVEILRQRTMTLDEIAKEIFKDEPEAVKRPTSC